jgi:hypothetical protein
MLSATQYISNIMSTDQADKGVANKLLTFQAAEAVVIVALFIKFSLTTISAIKGNLRFSWGYGELWVSYSEGFVRRGLSGEVLNAVSRYFVQDPYDLVVIFGAIFLILNAITAYAIYRHYESSYLARIYLLLNSSFFLFIINNPNSFIRKDHLIISGILVHSLYVTRLRENKCTKKNYQFLIYLLIPYTLLCGLLHEMQIFFIPIHIGLYLLGTDYIQVSKKKKLSTILLWISISLTSFIASAMFHGTPKDAANQVREISKTQVVETGAIEAIGWSRDQALALTKQMFSDSGTLLTFSVLLFLGPGIILFSKWRSSSRKDFAYGIFLLTPILSLFLLGWDWGRWIFILTFSIISILPIISRNQRIKVNQHRATLFLIPIVVIFSLLWQTPECCTRKPEEALHPFMQLIHTFGIQITP